MSRTSSADSRNDEIEIIPLDTEPDSPPPTTNEGFIEAFKSEIISSSKNNISQLLMIITSGMFVVMTTPEDGVIYYLNVILSTAIAINVISLLILIAIRKKVFKTKDGQCPAETMKKAKKLQKIYRCLSILLIVLQFFFTLVTGVSISGVMDDDTSNQTSTAANMATSAVGVYVVNNTL